MAETNSIIDTSDISLLYPDADSLRRHSLGEELAKLTSQTAEQLELYYLMDLKTCDFGSSIARARFPICWRIRSWRTSSRK